MNQHERGGAGEGTGDGGKEIDAAALAGAAMAASLSVLIAEGPFEWMNVVVGMSLLALVWAFEGRRPRRWRQSLAYGATVSLCALLCVGFVLEVWLSPQRYAMLTSSPRHVQQMRADAALTEKAVSEVPPLWIVGSWVVIGALVFARDVWRNRARRGRAGESAETVVVPMRFEG